MTTTLAAGGPAPTWKWQVEADGPWTVRVDRPNSARFEAFRLRIGDSAEEFPVRAKTFIDQVSDAAEHQRYSVAFKQTFGTPMRLSMAYPLTCTYRTEFVVEQLPASCRFGMDSGAISGDWRLEINGHTLTREQLSVEPVYDYANVGVDVLPLLCEGVNELVVTVEVGHDWDGVVDPLYLHGPFSVCFDERGRQVIGAATTQSVRLGEMRGYPFFAGMISYKRTVELASVPEATSFELAFAGWNVHDCVEVRVNGCSLGVRPWSPYRWSGFSSLLREGSNELEVRVAVSLIGLIEGKTFDYGTHTLVSVDGGQA